MDKEKIRSHFEGVIDRLMQGNEVFKVFFQSPWFMDDVDIDDKLHLFFGVRRCTIVDDDFDWVVKIELNEPHADGTCEKEMAVYEEAKKQGLEDCFVECGNIGMFDRVVEGYEFDGQLWDFDEEDLMIENREKHGEQKMKFRISFSMYAYKKVRTNLRSSSASTPEEESFLNKNKSPLTEKSELVGLEFMREYGEETYKKLGEFCKKYDINDLHCGNVGYDNGKIVLIDFAGYHESEEEEDW